MLSRVTIAGWAFATRALPLQWRTARGKTEEVALAIPHRAVGSQAKRADTSALEDDRITTEVVRGKIWAVRSTCTFCTHFFGLMVICLVLFITMQLRNQLTNAAAINQTNATVMPRSRTSAGSLKTDRTNPLGHSQRKKLMQRTVDRNAKSQS